MVAVKQRKPKLHLVWKIKHIYKIKQTAHHFPTQKWVDPWWSSQYNRPCDRARTGQCRCVHKQQTFVSLLFKKM